MTSQLADAITTSEGIRRPLLCTLAASGVFRVALIAGALALAAGLARTASFTLGASGVGLPAAQLAGGAVGTALLCSVCGLTLLLPRRALIVLAIALAGVLLVSLGAAVLAVPGVTPRTVTFGDATLVAMPLALLVSLGLQAWLAAGRVRVRHALWVVASDWSWPTLLAGVLVGTTMYVEGSRHILFWDWQFYWAKADWLASLINLGQWSSFVRNVVDSIGDDYSLVPAALPGLLIAPLPRFYLLGYALSLAVCYLVPALLAVGALGLALARPIMPRVDALSWRERVRLTTLGAVAAMLLLPHFLQVVLKYNMPDIGGVLVLVLLVLALRRLLRVLLEPSPTVDTTRHAWSVVAAAVGVTALSVVAFIFRRWYAFEIVGLVVAALCCLVAALPRQERHWPALLRDLALAACAALLTVIATTTPILVQWMLHWRNRDYAEAYAAYWRDWPRMLLEFKCYFGLLVPASCGLLMVILLLRARQRALPAMLLISTVVAVVGFHQIQGAGVQHYYLLMPLLGGLAAAGAILLARLIGAKPTLLILFVAGWLLGLAPRHYDAVLVAIQPSNVDLWPVQDADADELARLGHWLDTALRPDEHYCVIASGVTFNEGVLLNVWQVDPSLVAGNAMNRILGLPQVDTRDGPPTNAIEHCTLMITATPPQTHFLHDSDQRSILLLLYDLLNAQGVGAAYRRLDTKFLLPSGITLEVFRQQHPIGDDAIRDLRRRFYKDKGTLAERYEARFGAP